MAYDFDEDCRDWERKHGHVPYLKRQALPKWLIASDSSKKK